MSSWDDPNGGYGVPNSPYAPPGGPPGMPGADLDAMRKKIDALQKLYFVLFVGSLVVLVLRYTVAMPPISFLGWAVLLGGAIATRLYRQSLANKYNQLLFGRQGPMV
jgi:hypothetical protein